MGLFDQGFGNQRGLSPAAVALLGLLAVKGFQNRDKLAGMLGGVLGGSSDDDTDVDPSRRGTRPISARGDGELGGLLGGLGGLLGGASTGGILSGGLRDILDRFEQSGQGQTAKSWVEKGPNQQLDAQQLEQAVGAEVIDHIAQQAGISRDEVVSRLSQHLPDAIDQLTPEGHVPSEEEAEQAGSRQA